MAKPTTLFLRAAPAGPRLSRRDMTSGAVLAQARVPSHMLFHTWPFLIFMLVVLPGFYALRRTRFWLPWLLLASYVFYGWWNPWYLILVAYSTVLDYLLVALMDHSREERGGRFHDPFLRGAFVISVSLLTTLIGAALVLPTTLRPTLLAFALLVLLMAVGSLLASRRIWLLISLFNNLALLLFFKYARFVAENLNHVLGALGTSIQLSDPAVLMPLPPRICPARWHFVLHLPVDELHHRLLSGQRRARAQLPPLRHLCLLLSAADGRPYRAGQHMLPQFHHAPPFRLQNLTDGCSLFLVGLFKKLALANYLSLYVERIYDNPGAQDATALTLATIAFAWQIFFDFSGYTDMARGVAKMVGFNLILNFNNPYLSTGLGEFWTRWHISLSSWFRDYVYIPLGGSRGGKFTTYRNLFITFLVSGIWHGAAWTFAIWGILHALGVMLTRELERSPSIASASPRSSSRFGSSPMSASPGSSSAPHPSKMPS